MTQLVKLAIEGDTEAFIELMEQHRDQMYKTAWAILKNDADVADVLQDTILTCYEKLGTLRQPEYFNTWMIRILVNKCYEVCSYYRRFDGTGNVPERPAYDHPLDGEGFRELLAMTDEKNHLILTLYYADGCSIAEISSILNMKENTVKTRLARAREQIRRNLDEKDELSYGF